MVKVYFNILHYNSFKATDMCVSSLLKLEGIEECKILIFDNCSTNDSLIQLKDKYGNTANIVFYANDGNDGFSCGNNKAYLLAKKENPDFIIALNNDIEIRQKNFIAKLYEIYKENPVYLIGPDVYCPKARAHQSPMQKSEMSLQEVDEQIKRIRNMDPQRILKDFEHRKKTQKFRKFIPYWMLQLREKLKHKEVDNSYKSKRMFDTVLQGSAIIATPLYIEKEDKLFEPDTKFYCEEHLLALKCRTLKYKTLYSCRLKVIHWHGISSGFESIPTLEQIQTKNDRLIKAYTIYRETLLNNPWKND